MHVIKAHGEGGGGSRSSDARVVPEGGQLHSPACVAAVKKPPAHRIAGRVKFRTCEDDLRRGDKFVASPGIAAKNPGDVSAMPPLLPFENS